MRKIILIIINLLFLTSCGSRYPKNLDYDYFANNTISFDAAINIKMEEKYIYVFSKHCGHCQNIKKEILKFAYDHITAFFFVSYSKDIKSCDQQDDLTTCIKGTPTLFYFNAETVSIYVGQNEIIDYIKTISNYI